MFRETKKSVESSRILSAKMKAQITPLISSSSRYDKGRVFGLKKPTSMGSISSKIKGVSLGADKDGFFVYTHRARSKSYASALKIPKKDIDWVETTG